ncbi:uncharacterized protein MELLADRAFT_87496 [Melampsora larici-populina 98AG31]|uniref:Tet-like 2OG-Fe(II) oxygenase domain-containing protein n=1 Tax=Melampsora larici-populina (strain 98AG31 / pathotype 3-4-7) TaxID=747676 RepID=F4RNJ1_MELLP|nr:uncharacterized protein MELLADRAFT_87496 [Melampsora larici-populina 98AG31]EGG06087.1 hypothetical protein MELLADRAFT_87496 [Melampsora larici-populina 98AG31]
MAFVLTDHHIVIKYEEQSKGDIVFGYLISPTFSVAKDEAIVALNHPTKDINWLHRKRPRYSSVIEEPSGYVQPDGIPGVKWLSDLLEGINRDCQKGHSTEDHKWITFQLPMPFIALKSFIHFPHTYLAKDGYAKTEYWLHEACRYSVPAMGRKQAEGDDNTNRAEGDHNANCAGLEYVATPKSRRQGIVRHVIRSDTANKERQSDQSPANAKKLGGGLNKENLRFNDPVLPVEDYERTMEIISNLYTVYKYGHGQFIDMLTKKLICTFQFDDLEEMKKETFDEHQKDVDFIMMASQLFQRLPTTPKPKAQPQPLTTNTEATLCQATKTSIKTTTSTDERSLIDRQISINKNTGLEDISSMDNNALDSSPLTPLTSSDLQDESLHHSLPEAKKTRPTTNGALIQGNMYCFGQRAGQLPNFGLNVGSRFETFADAAFLQSQSLLRELDAPPMSATSKDNPPAPTNFCGNFVFTFGNFHNKPHTDNDKVTESGAFELEGGWFLFPKWQIALKTGRKYALQIAWSVKSTFHQTMQSKEVEIPRPDDHLKPCKSSSEEGHRGAI